MEPAFCYLKHQRMLTRESVSTCAWFESVSYHAQISIASLCNSPSFSVKKQGSGGRLEFVLC